MRTTRPNSRNARFSLFWRLWLPSLRSKIEGKILPAWIESTTCIMSCQWVSIRAQSMDLLNNASMWR